MSQYVIDHGHPDHRDAEDRPMRGHHGDLEVVFLDVEHIDIQDVEFHMKKAA